MMTEDKDSDREAEGHVQLCKTVASADLDTVSVPIPLARNRPKLVRSRICPRTSEPQRCSPPVQLSHLARWHRFGRLEIMSMLDWASCVRLLVTEAVRAALEGCGRPLSHAPRTANGIGGMSTPLAQELLTLFIGGVPSRPR